MPALPGGDINKDDAVNLTDLVLVLQILAGANSQTGISELSDINGDMKTGWEECMYMLQFIAGDM